MVPRGKAQDESSFFSLPSPLLVVLSIAYAEFHSFHGFSTQSFPGESRFLPSACSHSSYVEGSEFLGVLCGPGGFCVWSPEPSSSSFSIVSG